MADEVVSIAVELDGRKYPGQARKIASSSDKMTRGFHAATKAAAAFGLAIGAAGLARGALNVAMRFQDLRVQLETVTGSAIKATAAFDKIKEFAASTPFQVANITEAFVGLKARGFEPTMATMRSLGNLAGAFGKDISTAMQAVTQAGFGEAEMLKQFGIIMRQQGEQVSITYDGMTQVIEKDSQKIVAALLEISDSNFAGAMERQSQTLTGRLSTLKDAFANLADEILGNGGFVDALTKATEAMTRFVQSPGFKQTAGAFARSAAATFNFLGEGLQGTMDDLVNLMNGPVPQAVGRANIALALMIRRSEGVEISVEAMDAAIRESLKATGGLEGGLSELNDTADETQNRIDELNKAGEEAADVFQNLIRVLGKLERESFSALREKADAYNSSQKAIFKTSASALAQGAKLLNQQRELAAAWRDEQGALDRLNNPIRQLADNFALIYGEGNPVVQLLRDMAGEFANLDDEISKAFESQQAQQAAQDFARRIGESLKLALADSLIGAVVTGDTAGGAKSAITAIFGAAGLALAGPVGAAIGTAVGGAVGDRFGGGEVLPELTSVVRLMSGAVERLEHSARALAQAVGRIRGTFGDLFRSLGGFGALVPGALLEGGPGSGSGGGSGGGGGEGGVRPGGFDDFGGTFSSGGLLSIIPDLTFVVNEAGGVFHASLANLVSGMGSSLEEAVRNMFDNFAKQLPFLIDAGKVSLEGVPHAIAKVLKNSAFQTFEDLQQAVEVASRFFTSSIGKVRADLFTFFGELRVAVGEAIRVGMGEGALRRGTFAEIEQFINQLAGVSAGPLTNMTKAVADFKKSIEGLPLAADQAADAVARFKDAVRAANIAAKEQVFGTLAGWAKELGVNAGIQRKAARLSLRLEFLKLKLTAQTLGIWRDVRGVAQDLFRQMLDQVGQLGNELAGAVGAGGFGEQVNDAGSLFRDRVRDAADDLRDAAQEGKKQNRDFAAQGLKDLREFGRRLSPLDALMERARELWETNLFRSGSRLRDFNAALNQALGNLLEAAKQPVMDFLDRLSVGEGSGNLFDRIGTAQQLFQDALQTGIETLDFSGATSSAQTLLQLAEQTYGTSSFQYQQLLQMVQDQLGDLVDLTPADIPRQQLDALEAQSAVIVDQGKLRRQQATRHHDAQMGVLKSIRAGLSKPLPANA